MAVSPFSMATKIQSLTILVWKKKRLTICRAKESDVVLKQGSVSEERRASHKTDVAFARLFEHLLLGGAKKSKQSCLHERPCQSFYLRQRELAMHSLLLLSTLWKLCHTPEEYAGLRTARRCVRQHPEA